jgi:hypothetical protein
MESAFRELKKHRKAMNLQEEAIPKWLEKEDPLSLNNRLLSYCGLLPANTDTKRRVNMLICTLIITLSITMVTGSIIKAYNSLTDFMEFIECATNCITQLKCLIKFVIVLIYTEHLRYVIDNLKRNFYVHENMFRNEIISKIRAGKRVARWITIPYTSLFITTIGLIAAEKISAVSHANTSSVAGNGTNITQTLWRFPLKVWLPISDKESPWYEMGFIYQIFSFTLAIYSTCIIDTFVVVLVMFAAIQYGLLGRAIQLPAASVHTWLRTDNTPLKGKLHIFLFISMSDRTRLWCSGQSSWLQIQRSGFESRHTRFSEN